MANPKTPPKNQSKFSVYVNPAISSALSARSLRPSMFAFAIIITVCLASAVAMLGLFVWEQTVVELIAAIGILQYIAYGVVKVLQIIVGLVFLAGILALLKALSLQRMADSNGLDVFQTPPRDSATRSTPNKPATRSTPNKPTPTSGFTEHQQELLGLRKRNVEQGNTDTPSNIGSRQQPQRSKKSSTPSPSSLLAPVHQLASKSSRGLGAGQSQWSGLERRDVGVSNISPFTIPVANRSPGSQGPPSLPGSQVPGQNTSPWDRQFSTPWSKPRPSLTKEEIPTEEKLEEFLADVEEKMSESASKAPTPSNQGLTTPSPSLHGIGGSTPSPVPNSGSFSGTPRNTSLRTVRMSPSSQKFSTPPKKGDGDLPPPMSLEQSMEAFQNLGVYPHIEQWSDRLRQWFSEVLLNPLVQKIETSHIQVMQAAAKLGISITITQVGSNVPDSGVPSAASSDNAANEWQTTFTLDEDGVLHQLRATLIQARDAPPTPQPSLLGLQPPKEKPFNPLIQECLDAVTEHQRLRALMKGEWVKGLLPQSSVRADYTVQRIKELAEGTCVKKYEFEGRGEFYDKVNKRWTLELPTDSHLLLYLFCALLEHPQWMLHVEPTSYPSTQSSNNPLFVGILPPRERFPEKYVAVLSSVPTVLHPGACVLVVGKQSPPVFALYWDKKLQFSLQGRTALWDAILLFCHRIKVAHGRMVRGINLGSSALNILSVFEPQSEGNVS